MALWRNNRECARTVISQSTIILNQPRSRPQCLRCFLLSLAVMHERALESRLEPTVTKKVKGNRRTLIACISLEPSFFSTAVSYYKNNARQTQREIWNSTPTVGQKQRKNYRKMWIFCFKRDTINRLVDCCLLLVNNSNSGRFSLFSTKFGAFIPTNQKCMIQRNTACRYQAIVHNRVREKCGGLEWKRACIVNPHPKNLRMKTRLFSNLCAF